MVTKHKVFNLKAYAKINLFLHVLKKRKNGFHNLESLICFLNLYDEIKIIKDNKFSIEYPSYSVISCGGTSGQSAPRNLFHNPRALGVGIKTLLSITAV